MSHAMSNAAILKQKNHLLDLYKLDLALFT